MDADVKAGKSAVTSVIRSRTTSLKTAIRKQVKHAIPRAENPERLANTVRGITFPKRGTSLNAAGQVYSVATYKRSGGIVDIITVLEEGATIKTRAGGFLAFPVSDRVKGRGTKGNPVSRSPTSFPAGTFTFKPSPKGGGVLVFTGTREVAYILKENVTLAPKKINIEKAYNKATRDIDNQIVVVWERNHARTTTKFDVDL